MKLDPNERNWDQAFGGIFWDGLLPVPAVDDLPFPVEDGEEEEEEDEGTSGGTSGDEYYLDEDEDEASESEPQVQPQAVADLPDVQEVHEESDRGSSTETASESLFDGFPEGTLFEKFSYEIECLMCPGSVRYHFVSTPDAAGLVAGLIQGKRLHPVCGQCYDESLGGGDLQSLPVPVPRTTQEDDGQ